MTNYNNGKIYKIISNTGDKIYIGSTVKKLLCDRMTGHRFDYKRWKNGDKKRIYKSFELFDEYGVENCKIVLIENYPCSNRDELTAREAFFIRSTVCVNRYIPGRTKEEYRTDPENKAHKKILDKEYRTKNIDAIKKQREEAFSKLETIQCACGGCYKHKHGHLKTKMHLRYVASTPV